MNEASASLNRLETFAGIANDGIPHHAPHPTQSVDANAVAAYMAALPASRKALGDPDALLLRPARAGLPAWLSLPRPLTTLVPAQVSGTIQMVTNTYRPA